MPPDGKTRVASEEGNVVASTLIHSSNVESMKKAFVAFIVCFASAASSSTTKPCPPFDSATALVPSEEAAITYARHVWRSFYDNNVAWRDRFGTETIESFEPYSAVLNGGLWFVSGKPRNGKAGPTMQICASDRSGSIGGP